MLNTSNNKTPFQNFWEKFFDKETYMSAKGNNYDKYRMSFGIIADYNISIMTCYSAESISKYS